MNNGTNENSIQENCINLYNKNMEYFKEHFPELEKKLTTFNHAINYNMYEPVWELEYKEDGYFDIYNIQEKYYYYDTNTVSDAEKIVENYKLDESNSFNNLKHIVPPDEYEIDKDEDFAESGYKYLFPIYQYINKNSNQEHLYTKIDKFIFLGTGVGLHINKLAKKLNAKTYLIIEPNIEIFRLSLFVNDYTTLLDAPEDLFFSIAEVDSDFLKTLDRFHNKFALLNYRFKFHCLTEQYHRYFDIIANTLNQKDPLKFPYNVQLKTLKRNIDYLLDDYRSIVYDNSILKNHKICIVAPGPSLEKGGIEWLKENHDKFIIVSIGAALKKLVKYDIVPDIITSVDPHDITKNQFEIDNEDFFTKPIFLCSTNTHPDIVKKFEKENVYLYPILFNIINHFQSAMGGTTVGEITYALMLILGASEIYLFGTDAALDPDTGATHSKEHIHYRTKQLKKTELLEFNSVTNDDLVEVDGNLRDKVFTTRLFYAVINNYNSFTTRFKNENQTVYNTADGAKLQDIPSIEYEKIDITVDKLDKEQLHEQLKENINRFAQKGFNKENIKSAKNDVKELKKVLKNIKDYKKLKFTDYDSFQYERIGLLMENIKISKQLKNENFISYITNSYIQTVDNIIFNFFEKNTKNKKNKEHIKILNNFWVEPYEKIYQYIFSMIEKIAKEKGDI